MVCAVSSYQAANMNIKEAMRVPTPPWDEGTTDGNPRGYLTEGTLPATNEKDALLKQPHASKSPRHGLPRRSLSGRSKEWWKNASVKPVRNDPFNRGKVFEFDVPEHLPNSPLCPANKQHSGGGKGLCVYHGRSRAHHS